MEYMYAEDDLEGGSRVVSDKWIDQIKLANTGMIGKYATIEHGFTKYIVQSDRLSIILDTSLPGFTTNQILTILFTEVSDTSWIEVFESYHPNLSLDTVSFIQKNTGEDRLVVNVNTTRRTYDRIYYTTTYRKNIGIVYKWTTGGNAAKAESLIEYINN